jgi:hypothetical protein
MIFSAFSRDVSLSSDPCQPQRGLTLLGIALIAGLCASCILPLTLQYYVPVAPGAEIRSMSCSGDPPFSANLFAGSPRFEVMVSLVQPSLTTINNPSLTMIIDPFHSAALAVDPTLIRVEADGQSIVPRSIGYYTGKSAPRISSKANGPIELKADYLVIHLPLGISGASQVVTHLPPITVEGRTTSFPDVSFKLEKHTRLITVAGNC